RRAMELREVPGRPRWHRARAVPAAGHAGRPGAGRRYRGEPARSGHLGQGPRAALDHLAGDDRALDLAGALPDPLDPELAVEPLGPVLAHVAAAAEDLHRAIGDPPGHLRAVQLGHRALGVSDLDVAAPVDAAGGLVGEGPGREQLGEAVREHAGDQAELA